MEFSPIESASYFWKHFRYRKYFISVAIVAAAAGLEKLLWPMIQPASFVVFYPALILTEFLGDGLTGIVFSTAAISILFLEQPLQSAGPGDWIRLAIFLLTAVMIQRMARSLRRTAMLADNEKCRAQRSETLLAEAFANLRLSEARIRSVFESALDAVVGMDDQGLITHWNPQAKRIFGFTAEEVIGKRMSETIIPTRYREAHERGMRHYLISGDGPMLNRRFEISAIRRDGLEFPIELSISPIRIGGPTFFAGFLRDISDQKRAQLELETSKVAADRANQAKTQFLANMSHEIRTPIGVIQGFADLLEEDKELTGERREWVRIIGRNTRLLTSLIGEILDLSRVEADKLEIENIDFQLADVLDDIVASMRFKAEEKGLAFHIALDRDVPKRIVSDPTRLRQILINMIGNAIKFTEHGHVSVHVSRILETPQLSVLIQDTGIGLSTSQSERIFEPFVQADSSMTRRFGGTGLGLAISKRLANALNGDLELISSQPGHGSTFRLTFCGPASTDPQADFKVQPEPNRCLSKKRLLIVEDSIDNQFLMRRYLKDQGASIEIACNGREGLRKATSEVFDLILMDIQMPEMDGYEALREMRAHGLKLPILALTAHALKEERDRARRESFDDYLTKPITKSVLLERISAALKD